MTPQEPVIVIDKLVKSYGKVQAVRGISMSVERGEIFGFLGPNRAGKTTTIRCMLDVIRPSAGTIRVLGMDALAMHQHIGYLPGDVRLPGQMTGRQVIDYFSRLQGREPVLLNDLVARFDVEMKRPLKGYPNINASRAAGGAAVGIIALGYLVNTFGGLADQFNWLLKIGPFYYAPAIDPLINHQLTWWHPWILVIAGLVFGIVGLVVFNKRDLPTV